MCVCVCVCVCVVCRYDKERLRTKLLEVCNPRKSPTKMLFYQTHMMVFFSFTSNFLLRNSSYVYIQRYLSKLYKAVSYIYFCGNWNIPKGKKPNISAMPNIYVSLQTRHKHMCYPTENHTKLGNKLGQHFLEVILFPIIHIT